jgi:hypothetical protein
MSGPISIQTNEVALTPAEVRTILGLEAMRSSALWGFTGGCIAFVAGLSVYGYYLRGDFAVLDAWLPFLLCVGLWWILALFVSPWFVSRAEGYRRFRQPARFRFSRDTIRQESADGAVRELPIASLARVKIRETYSILQDGDGSVILIPNKAFRNLADAQQARELLRASNPSGTRSS